MKVEAIILYIFQVIFILLEAYIAYLALQYLKRKPLGMQTILDKVVKDTIMCVLFHQIMRVFVESLIIDFARPLSDNVAFMISILFHFCAVIRVWQFFMVIVVRYMLVFYHTYVNAFDEKVTRRLIRIFVCTFSAIPALVESKNTLKYVVFSNEYPDPDNVTRPKFLSALFTITFISLFITHYQIQKFKKGQPESPTSFETRHASFETRHASFSKLHSMQYFFFQN